MSAAQTSSPFDGMSTGEAMFVVDQEFNVLHWSDQAAALLGFERADVLGRRCYDVIGGAPAGNSRPCGSGCPMVTGRPHGLRLQDYDMLSRCADGSHRWLNVTTVVHESPPEGSGRRRHVMHLLRDATEKRNVETYARASADRLRAATSAGSSAEPGGSEHRDHVVELYRSVDDACGRPRLSRRELQVLRLLAHGASTEDMAAAMGVAPVTTRNHVSRLLTRLGVSTRLQAVLSGARHGLI